MKTELPDNDVSTSIFIVRQDLSTEDALVNASELLASALATANEQAFSLSGSERLQTFGLAQLIENAGLLVDVALERLSPTDI
ncbi:hypothetical protein BFW87_26535 [Pseudomonas fluorescens]|uniref:DUF3077 domain-containing protein n=1 Tax=Pseudomonas fluorescens TaxID=294 RepID=A0A1T2Y2J8_PSEFL|nr:hypothetical protein [Pseudomonas fluorescens]OPA86299.1 hypothetical protein BFW87_26535 [Pseudomonas fluorescens]